MDWIGEHATELLTAALVLVTAVYAWLTWRVVRETREGRRQQVLPYMQLYLEPAGAGIVFPTVVNAGVGAATHVTATIEAVHRETGEITAATFRRDYMAPGAFEQIMLRLDDSKILELDKLADTYASMHLTATMRDVLGREHRNVNGIDDLPRWRDDWGGMHTRMQKDQTKRIADELEKIRKYFQQ